MPYKQLEMLLSVLANIGFNIRQPGPVSKIQGDWSYLCKALYRVHR